MKSPTPPTATSDSSDFDERAAAESSLRLAVRSMCHSLDVELDVERAARLDAMPVERLVELVGALNANRRWPEGY